MDPANLPEPGDLDKLFIHPVPNAADVGNFAHITYNTRDLPSTKDIAQEPQLTSWGRMRRSIWRVESVAGDARLIMRTWPHAPRSEIAVAMWRAVYCAQNDALLAEWKAHTEAARNFYSARAALAACSAPALPAPALPAPAPPAPAPPPPPKPLATAAPPPPPVQPAGPSPEVLRALSPRRSPAPASTSFLLPYE